MLESSPADIRQWLAHLPKGCDIAIEATSTFRNSDAFIAFPGLDGRVRDSGKSRGKRN